MACSIKGLQQMAMDSNLDHEEEADLVASLGNGGRSSQNIERDFHRVVTSHLGIGLRLYHYDAPVRKSGKTSIHTFSAVLPHELFAHLYTWDAHMFETIYFGEEGSCRLFWHMLEAWSPEWWRVHPHRPAILEDPDNFAPMMLWGDECAVNKERNRNIAVQCIYSIVSDAQNLFKYMLIWMQRREWQIKRSTDFEAYAVTTWSCNALMAGKWPTHDHLGNMFVGGYRARLAGQELVPGRRAIVVAMAPDWKYAKETFGHELTPLALDDWMICFVVVCFWLVG